MTAAESQSGSQRSYYHPDIMCGVIGIDYSHERRSGCLYIPKYHCTDMSGTIRVFQLIDPEVQSIVVLAEGQEDIRYVRRNEKWIAQDAKKVVDPNVDTPAYEKVVTTLHLLGDDELAHVRGTCNNMLRKRGYKSQWTVGSGFDLTGIRCGHCGGEGCEPVCTGTSCQCGTGAVDQEDQEILKVVPRVALQEALFHWPDGPCRQHLENLFDVEFERGLELPDWWEEPVARRVRRLPITEILELPRNSVDFRHAQRLVMTSV